MSSPVSAPISATACVILAGGRSRRFGANKAFAELRGVRLIDHLVERLSTQTNGPIAINAPADMGDAARGYALIPDRLTGDIGPLAGLHAALSWAADEGIERVITTPVDTPMLPNDYVARLLESGAPSVSRYQDRTHSLHGIWSVALRSDLEHAIQTGLRAAHQWAAACEAQECVFPAQSGPDPFFNINTKDDLRDLLDL